MHPHIALTIAGDRVADRVCFAERERTARVHGHRRRRGFALRRFLTRRPAIEARLTAST